MKVRTKLAVFLFAVIATFVAGLVAIKSHDHKRFRAATEAREQERRWSFDEFLRHRGESLETFANYFSCLDDLVAALARNDRTWAETNLNEDTLKIYRAHAVWVYNSEGALVITRNILYTDAVPEVPMPPGTIKELFANQRVCQFYAQSPLGLMEVCGATVHPSKDAARASPPRGYFFAGRLWTNEDVKEISLFTGNAVRVISPAAVGKETLVDPHTGAVSFSRALPGWDKRPVGMLAVRSESPVVQQLNISSERQFLWLIAFACVVFLVFVVSLTLLVNRPVNALSNCLKSHDLSHIDYLQNHRSEFGDVARLIRAFFEQREDLLREISERRQTEAALQVSEERLRHSQKMEAIGRLAGGIAHDFNNLLTAIIGYAELIILRTQSGVVKQDAELICKAGEQAADLTRQLLAFSRKQILQPRVIDLNALMLEIEKLLQRIIGEHIELRVQAKASNGRVRADPTQLEQVILNLGINARDAMPRGGVLTMGTSTAFSPETFEDGGDILPPGRYVALTVQDTGCGMDTETKERIFEPFFTTKGPGKGTGLGLATVYGIVRQSGGAISVESKPGEGSTFTIHLPEETAPIEGPRNASVLSEKSREGETVLVVEDEEIVRDLICEVLMQHGYNVLSAAHGTEGLRLARDHPGRIDLLVTDIIMPQMNGPEVARALRKFRPDTKILFVSGYSDNDIVDQGVLAPEVRFLDKPFTPAALAGKVREVLDEPALALH
jgi:signal transduction histidine kinase/CheY-like chemotaxis protein